MNLFDEKSFQFLVARKWKQQAELIVRTEFLGA